MPKKLSKYNQKRDFKKTSEPIGESVKSKRNYIFVFNIMLLEKTIMI